MKSKLSIRGIAIGSAIITAIFYIVCFLIVLIFGDASLKFFQLFVHGIDLTSLATTPDILGGILGLIISIIVAYMSGWIFAIVYNKYAD